MKLGRYLRQNRPNRLQKDPNSRPHFHACKHSNFEYRMNRCYDYHRLFMLYQAISAGHQIGRNYTVKKTRFYYNSAAYIWNPLVNRDKSVRCLSGRSRHYSLFGRSSWSTCSCRPVLYHNDDISIQIHAAIPRVPRPHTLYSLSFVRLQWRRLALYLEEQI